MRKLFSIIENNIKLNLIGLTFLVAMNAYITSMLAVKLGGLYDAFSSERITSIKEGLIPILTYFLIYLLGMCLDVFNRFALQNTILKNAANLKSEGIAKILKSKVSYHTECLSAEKSTSVFRGIHALNWCIGVVVDDMFTTAFLVIFSLYQLLKIAPFQIAIITLFSIILFSSISIIYINVVKKLKEKIVNLDNEFSGKSTQCIQNIEFIRATNAFKAEKNNLDDNINDLYKWKKRNNHIWGVFELLKRCLNIISLATIMLFCIYFISNGTLKAGSAIAVCMLFNKVVSATWPVSYYISNFASNMIEAKKLLELMNSKEDETLMIKSNNSELDNSNSNIKNDLIEFHDVEVLTPKGDKVLGKYRDITLDTTRITSLKGVTGAGKTSLIRALLRYYPSNDLRNIKVFGKPLSALSHKELTDAIYYVTQNSFFFLGTIRKNLLYGLEEKVSDEKLISVLKEMFLVGSNNGQKGQEIAMEDKILDYNLTEGATNLSGGQRQRLSIARALLKAPKLFIFDESTANIDKVTAEKVLSNIENYAHSIHAGIVYISHDENVVKRCQCVVDVKNDCYNSLVNF